MDISDTYGMEHDIVNGLDYLYSKHLIYRTIIVCEDNELDNYKFQLETHDHSVYVLTKYESIDYDIIDTRIYMISEENFINFIEEYKLNDDRYFYNAVVFTSQKNKEVLKIKYKGLINNDNIII
jgi:hypothetical protein